MKTREDHLQWSKDAAMAHWRAGNVRDAVATMVGRLKQHPELKYHDSLMALGIIYVMQEDYEGVRRWIEGFR